MGNTLSKVHIVNFLSHRDTTIHFHEGVNAMIGISKSGKSTVMRALDWVFTNSNRPSWEALQSYWGGDILVETYWGNGNVVSRGHDKDGNFYELNDLCRANGSELRAIGQGDPPEEVMHALNLNEINFQGQMDSPFLLSSSPGEVAQLLNKAVHLDVIDRAISNANKKKFEISTKCKQSAGEIEKLTIQLKDFDYLENMERDVLLTEATEVALGTKKELLSRLSIIVEKLTAMQCRGQLVTSLLCAEKGILDAQLCSGKIEKLKEKIAILQNIVRKIKSKKEREESLYLLLKSEKAIDYAYSKLESLWMTSAHIDRIQNIQANIRNAQERAKTKEKEIEDSTLKFETMMPDVCPLCGDYTDGHIH